MGSVANMMIVQLSSANGPLECQLAVEKCLTFFIKEADSYAVSVEILENNKGSIGIKSILLGLEGPRAVEFAKKWDGTHQWQWESTIRPHHRRKNWLFGGRVFGSKAAVEEITTIDPKDLDVTTCRASGAGGQHVNKTDSAVQITHLPTGIRVRVQSYRSQHQNRQCALELLQIKMQLNLNADKQNEVFEQRMHHHQIRPNTPVRYFKGNSFQEVFP